MHLRCIRIDVVKKPLLLRVRLLLEWRHLLARAKKHMQVFLMELHFLKKLNGH